MEGILCCSRHASTGIHTYNLVLINSSTWHKLQHGYSSIFTMYSRLLEHIFILSVGTNQTWQHFGCGSISSCIRNIVYPTRMGRGAERWYLSKNTMFTVQRNWIVNWFVIKFGELNWIVNWIEMICWWLNWIVNWVLMQWASCRIEFELNSNTLSESELSRESRKAESLQLWWTYFDKTWYICKVH